MHRHSYRSLAFLPFLLALLTVLGTVSHCRTAETKHPVREVTYCDLMRQPEKYSGQFVRVQGDITFGFEQFEITDSACQLSNEKRGLPLGVWLMFGGDEDDAVIYCCGDHSPSKGKDIVVDGVSVGLVRNRQLREFRRALDASRLRRPGGGQCETERECRLYRVKATLTGLFVAMKKVGNGYSGFGHFGSFHVLVIEQVNEVRAERTAVPAGGRFQCQADQWSIDPSEVSALGVPMDCEIGEDGQALALGRIARHWNDAIDVVKGTLTGFRDESSGIRGVDDTCNMSWVSEDLLISYSTITPRPPRPMKVVRRVCRRTEPFPAQAEQDPISCTDRRRSWTEDSDASREFSALRKKEQYDVADELVLKTARKLFVGNDASWTVGEPRTVARRALARFASSLNLASGANMVLESCSRAGQGNLRHATCTWAAPDGMQTADVDLAQHRRVYPDQWVVTTINVRTCRVGDIPTVQ